MTIEKLQEQLLQTQEELKTAKATTEQLTAKNQELETKNNELRDYNNKLFMRVTNPIKENKKETEPLSLEAIGEALA